MQYIEIYADEIKREFIECIRICIIKDFLYKKRNVPNGSHFVILDFLKIDDFIIKVERISKKRVRLFFDKIGILKKLEAFSF